MSFTSVFLFVLLKLPKLVDREKLREDVCLCMFVHIREEEREPGGGGGWECIGGFKLWTTSSRSEWQRETEKHTWVSERKKGNFKGQEENSETCLWTTVCHGRHFLNSSAETERAYLYFWLILKSKRKTFIKKQKEQGEKRRKTKKKWRTWCGQ